MLLAELQSMWGVVTIVGYENGLVAVRAGGIVREGYTLHTALARAVRASRGRSGQRRRVSA